MKYVNNTDINSPNDRALSAADPVGGAYQHDMVRLIELIFFAYRDFVAAPDQILATENFGRAHHRVVHFVNRNYDIANTQ